MDNELLGTETPPATKVSLKKRLLLVALVLIVAAAIVASGWTLLQKGLLPTSLKLPSVSQNKDEKIVKAETENGSCKIKITTDKKEFTLETQVSEIYKECLQGLQITISPSGKYLAFEDASGGIDTMPKLYSLEKNTPITLGVWGTTQIFNFLFLADNRLLTLSGWRGIPDSQVLAIFNTEKIFADYPNSLDPNRYLKGEEAYTRRVDLPKQTKDYDSLSFDGDKVSVKDEAGQTLHEIDLSQL